MAQAEPAPRGPHNRRMDTPDPVDRRLTDLESKVSFTEDLIDRLDEIVTAQQAQIDRLQRQIAELRHAPRADEPPVFRSLRDELPPHF
jgi:SlyX protein